LTKKTPGKQKWGQPPPEKRGGVQNNREKREPGWGFQKKTKFTMKMSRVRTPGGVPCGIWTTPKGRGNGEKEGIRQKGKKKKGGVVAWKLKKKGNLERNSTLDS